MSNVIPLMEDPMGSWWNQPSKEDILVGDDTATLSETDFKKLKDYSRSMPSGVYPGKMWKRFEIDEWFLVWYGEETAGRCSINFRRIIVSDWRALLGV